MLIRNTNLIKILLVGFSFFCGCAFNADMYSIGPDDGVVSEDQMGVPANSEVRYLFIRGELALKQDDYKEALSFFEEARKKTKIVSPTIEKRMAQLYIRDGRLEDALKSSELMESAGGDLNESLKLKAGILSALGRTEEAITVYQKLLDNAGPGEEEPFLLLSGIYIQHSRFQDAVSVLEKLSKKNPNSFLASYYLAKLYASLKDFEKAIVFYKKALDLNSSAEQVALEYIKVLVLDKRVAEAIKECQKLVNQNPENAKARQFLTELLLGEKKIEMALNEFEEAKKLGKNPLDLQFKVALIKLQQRDFKGAESELNLILTQKPDYDEARYYLATAYASQDKLDAAVAQLKIVSVKNDLYKKARGFAAFLLRQEFRYSEALVLIKEAVKKYPNDLEILGYKTSIERESGDLGSAIETLRKISSLEPQNEQHLFNLGVALDEAKKRTEALTVIEKVIEKNPQHANALNFLGYTFAEEGRDLPRAEELVLRALEIEKDNGFFLDSLGWVYFQMGQFEKALPVLKKSVDITQGDPVILEHLGQTYLKLGDKDQAKEIFEQILEKISNDNSPSLQSLRVEVEQLLKSINK